MYVRAASRPVADAEAASSSSHRTLAVSFAAFWRTAHGVFGSGPACGGFFAEARLDEDAQSLRLGVELCRFHRELNLLLVGGGYFELLARSRGLRGLGKVAGS